MEDLATLAIEIDATSVDAAGEKLDKFTGKGSKAEDQVEKLIKKSVEFGKSASTLGVSIDEVAARVDRLKASTDPLYAAQSRVNKELAEARTLYKAGALAAADYEKVNGALTSQLNRVAMLQGRAAAGAKLHGHEMLNLSRQSADVFVTLAMGMNPLMILIQQGPQIAETFAMASARGIGFKAVLAELTKTAWGAVAPFAPFIAVAAAAAAVIGGGFLIATHEANKSVGDLTKSMGLTEKQIAKLKEEGESAKITFGDTFSAVFEVAGRRLYKAFEGPIKTVAGLFSWLYNGAVKGVDWMVGAIVGAVYAMGNVLKGVFGAMGSALKGDFDGAKAQLAAAFSSGISDGLKKGRKDWDAFKTDVVAEAKSNAVTRISKITDKVKEDKPAKTAKSETEKEYDRVIGAAQSYQRQLEKETATIGLNTYERKQAETALQVEALRKVESTAKSKAEKDVIESLIVSLNKQTLAYIEKAKAQQLSDMNRPLDDVLAKLTLETQLVNATAKERAVSLAGLAAEQQLTKEHIDLKSAGADKFIEKSKAVAAAQYEVDNATGSTLHKLQEIATLSGDTANRIGQAAANLGTAFGSVGSAIGNIVSTYADLIAKQDEYAAKMEAMRVAGKEDSAEYKTIANAKASAERSATGDMIKSAKGFFKEKSAGYKVLETAEKAWRLFEFAMEAKSVIVKMASTAAKLPAYAAETAAAATAGAAQMFAWLGPFGFAALAAMGVALAAWGFKGGGGGGGSVAMPTAEDIQAGQGTGSVFGDPTAKSASLANAVTLAEKYQNKDLEYSNSMLSVLHSIDNTIGALAGAVAKQIGLAGSMFDTKGLNLGTTAKSGFIGIGGKSTTKDLTDLGLTFNAQSLSDLLANGVSGSTYQNVQTTTTKQGFWGLGGGTKTTNDTINGTIAQDVKDSITEVVASLRDGVLAAAKALGIDGAEATVNAMNIALGTMSFEGMSGSEIQEQLNAVFGKLGDQMAEAVGGGLVEKFRKVGEGAFETLVRLATGAKLFDQQMSPLNKTLSLTGSAAINAKQSLIDLMGGLDSFKELTDSYAENYLSEAEKLVPVQKAVALEMTRLGLSALSTKTEFNQLVSGIDVSTEAGQKLFASLMQVAPAFAKVADASEAAAKQAMADAEKLVSTTKTILDNARNALVTSYQTEAGAMKTVIDKFKTFGKTLRDFITQLTTGPEAGLSPEASYQASKALFDKTYAQAKGGDETAIGQLAQVGEAFRTASKDYFASSSGYQTDVDYIKQAVGMVADYSDAQAATAQGQLDLLNGVIDGLDGVVDGIAKLGDTTLSLKDGIYTVDASVKSVAAAIADFKGALGAYTSAVDAQAALASQQAAQAQQAALAAQQQIAAALAAANAPTAAPGGGASPDPVGTAANDTWASLYEEVRNERPDVVAEANKLLGIADRNSPWFAQHGLDRGVDGFIDWWLSNKSNDNYTPNGRKAFAAGGIGNRPMTIGEAGIFAEAGPEGILPLTQVGGKLGVNAKSDDETKALLKEIAQLLKNGNDQRSEAGLKTIERLGKLLDSMDDFGREVARQ